MPDPRTSSPRAVPSADALADVLDRAQRPIVGFLAGLVGDGERARDLLQDVLYDAWRAYRRGAAPFTCDDEEAIRRWLFHTAYCRAVSSRRRWRRFRWESLDIPDATEPEPHTGPQVPFEDQNSTNFTFVNRQKLAPKTPTPIKDGDEIRLGRVVLKFETA